MTSPFRLLWSRLRSLVSKDRLDREFDDELATHLELLIDDARRRGLSESDARREALLKLGRPASLREQHRDARGFPLVDALVQDCRYAVRMLWKSPAFTVVVTLTLALGIGANTALFSLVDNLLLRSLPIREPDRLVQLQIDQIRDPGGRRKPWWEFRRPAFDAVRAQNQVFDAVVGFGRFEDRPTIAVDGAEEPFREVEQVSENFFTGLGVSPVIGRSPDASDGNVAVISTRWWRARFGGREDVIGRALTINGKKLHDRRRRPAAVPRIRDRPFLGCLDLAHLQRAETDCPPAAGCHARAGTGGGASNPPSVPCSSGIERFSLSQCRPRRWLWARDSPSCAVSTKALCSALMGLVTLVLLTTCTNVGNLIMLRNAARQRELTVRAALGAGRSRLLLQSLVETTLLAAAGCIAGLFLARSGVSIILSMLPLPVVPGGLEFHTDARVVGFATGVSALSALFFGLGPAWRGTDVDLTGALRSSQGVSAPIRTRLLGRVLVACQVGLSVLLLVGAGLFVQTLRNLSRLDMGFRPERLLQVSIDATRDPHRSAGRYQRRVTRWPWPPRYSVAYGHFQPRNW